MENKAVTCCDSYEKDDSKENEKTATDTNPESQDFHEVFVKELDSGKMGRYQITLICMLFLVNFLSNGVMEYIFVAATLPYRCRIPECGETYKDENFEPEWILNAIPVTSSGVAKCKRYAPSVFSTGNGSIDFCPAGLFNQSIVTECESFVYGKTNSLVYDFDLGCQEWYRALAGTLGSIGQLIGLPITGFLSDKYGRKFAMIFGIINVGIYGVLKSFSVNYEMYLVLSLLLTTFGIGTATTTAVYITEVIPPKYAVTALIVTSSGPAFGMATLGLEAMLIQNWRTLLLALHIPCFILISYYWFLPESIKWLITKRKYQKASEELAFMAKVNRTKLSEKLKNVAAMQTQGTEKTTELAFDVMIRKIFKSRELMKRVFITPICWISCTLVYYGLSINSTSLSSNIYLNYILVSLIQVPGYLTVGYFMRKYGRRPTLFCGYLLCAVCNIAFVFIPKDITIARLLVYLLGKFAISGVYSSLYLYTSELFSTDCRHRLLAFCSTVGRIGAILAPLTPALIQYWSGIPSVMFGVMGLLSAVLFLFQPETMGRKLPATLDDIATDI